MKKKFQDIRISVVYLSSEDLIATSQVMAMGIDVDDMDYDYQAPERMYEDY